MEGRAWRKQEGVGYVLFHLGPVVTGDRHIFCESAKPVTLESAVPSSLSAVSDTEGDISKSRLQMSRISFLGLNSQAHFQVVLVINGKCRATSVRTQVPGYFKHSLPCAGPGGYSWLP